MIERRDLPLFAFGDALGACKARRRLVGRRAAAIGLLGAGLVATTALPPQPRLVWNASASAAIGLYAVTPGATPQLGDMVIARVPEPYRMFAARRHYLPDNVPLVKRVRAEPGDAVCAFDRAVFVNGRRIATRRFADARGRVMPWWTGCVTLRRGALLLLMEHPDSFDGRYFGPTERGDIIGTARLLWRR
ncbi:MAG: S26 family signal peptidase [Qipengyuania sp.]|nr:S26 family signal peptidase [Qipengyuania sp.]